MVLKPETMNNCNCCFTDTLTKCQTEIQVNAMLQPEAAYRWVITDKFNNKYEGNVTTDGSGFFAIPIDELPAGMLNQYNGTFKLQVFQQDAACSAEKFKVAGVFDCIEFEVTGGTFEKNNLGCDFDCNPASNQSTLLLFSNETEVVIDWSTYSPTYGNSPTISVYHEASPGVYTLVSVEVLQSRVNGVLQSITIDNGGAQTGYVVIS